MKKALFYIVMGIFVVGLLGGLGVSLKLYFDSQEKIKVLQASSGATSPAPEDVKTLVQKVGRHIMLPDEDPKIVTISNVDVLKKDQAFFNKATNGDKLLIYSNRVILYNPDSDKIIDIAQIKATSGTEASASGSVAGAKAPSPTKVLSPTTTATPTPTTAIPQLAP